MFMLITLGVCAVMAWLLYLAEREVWRAGR